MSFQIFEDEKENRFSTNISHSDRDSQYEASKLSYEQQIAKFSGVNIFPLYQRYLALIKEHETIKSTAYKNISYKLLKELADSSKFLPQVRYNPDYVKLWLEHISTYEPEDQISLFQFMNSKSIGLTLPLFYIAWATCMEQVRNFPAAEKIYEAGSSRFSDKDKKMIETHFMNFKERIENEERKNKKEKKRKLEAKRREKKKMKLEQAQATNFNEETPNVAYNKDAVYTVNGEYQFEELRAMLPKYHIVPKSLVGVEPFTKLQEANVLHSDPEMDMDSDREEDVDIIHSKLEDEDVVNKSEMIASCNRMDLDIKRQQNEVSNKPEPSPAYEKGRVQAQNSQQQTNSRISEVTLFTKKAMNEINSMFCGSLETTEELFFEKKKEQRQHKNSQQHASIFQIHEDNTQELQQASSQIVPAMNNKPPVAAIMDKENQQLKPLKQVMSRVSNVSQSNLSKQIRRLSQAPRASMIRKISLAQQNISAIRQSGVSSIGDNEEYYDDDLNESLYLDTDTIALNHDLSETINFHEIMSGKDAVTNAFPTLKQVLANYIQQCGSSIVSPYDTVVMEQMQNLLIQPYAENDRRFSDERGKPEPNIPDKLPQNSNDDNKCAVQLGSREYVIGGLLGEGAYACVYSANYRQPDSRLSETFALKVQSPACPWEFYICDQLQRRADVIFSDKFIKPWRMFLYDNKSFLLLPYSRYGTLLDLVNSKRECNKVMEEAMVMYYTIELLKVVKELHSCSIIHGDIKPDNCLIMNEDSGVSEHWKREGGPAWSSRGIILIDFGRSIDMSLYPKGTKFIGDHGASCFKCIEMQTGKPWTYQADLYGIAAVVHTMLFNKYMEVEQKTDQTIKKATWAIKEKFKRYHSKLWAEFFEAMLNMPDCDTLPNLKYFQEKFEDYIIEKKWERVVRGLWAKQFVPQ